MDMPYSNTSKPLLRKACVTNTPLGISTRLMTNRMAWPNKVGGY